MKARIFWIAVGLSLLGLIGWRVLEFRARRAHPETRAAQAARVRSAKVVRADLAETVTFTGTIRPRNEVDVFTKVPGRVESLRVEVGDKVKAGQVLAVVEHREIAWQARAGEAATQVAGAQLDGAKLAFERTEALFKGGSATAAQVDGARVTLALAQAQLAQAQAAAGLAAQNLANATLLAPISGTVTRRPANLGTMLGPGVPVLTLQDAAALKLEASVDAAAFARLARGAPATVSVDSLPGERFPGEVRLLSPTLDPATRRAALEIEIDNASGRLLPHMFARAEVKVGDLAGALALPRAALLEAGGGAVVYRLRAGRAERVRPRLGPTDGERVAVLEGLAEGDEVALTGQADLSDGAAVEVLPEPGAGAARR